MGSIFEIYLTYIFNFLKLVVLVVIFVTSKFANQWCVRVKILGSNKNISIS